MTIIRKKFKITIPDEFLHDDIVTPTTQDWEYIGDDVIYAYVDKVTNLVSPATITEEMFNDGRPVPRDKYVVRIDADENPLVASLIPGPGKEDNDFELNRPDADVLVDSHPDYGDYYEPAKYHLYELFDTANIFYDPETEEFSYRVLHYTDVLNTSELTWDMLREKRDDELKATDGMESGDMPESMITELRAYRQKLRDWPNAMADKDPWIAYNLFPQPPNWF